MPRRIRLVVDADVARAAGGDRAARGASKACRSILETILEVCHRIVLTPDLNDEWREHASRFARTWLVRMYARRKVDWDKRPIAEPALSLPGRLLSQKDRDALAKDLHVIDAAFKSDRAVVSLDDTTRNLLRTLASTVSQLRRVSWVNPKDDPEASIRWLENGARSLKSHRLDH